MWKRAWKIEAFEIEGRVRTWRANGHEKPERQLYSPLTSPRWRHPPGQPALHCCGSVASITCLACCCKSSLNASLWLCPCVDTIPELGCDENWNWHPPNSVCPGASLHGSATVTSSSIPRGHSVSTPMTPVRNFQVSAHFFINVACTAQAEEEWHLGWGRGGQCLPPSASSGCQFGFCLYIWRLRPRCLVI